jgi:hypothetical protein
VGTYLRSFSQISPTSVARQEIYVRDPKKIKVDYDLPRTLSNNSAVLLDNVPHILSSATLIITNSSRRQRRIKLVEDLVGIHLKQCNLSVKLSNELAHHQNLSRACLLPDSVVVVVPAPSPNKQRCSVVVCLILCLLLPPFTIWQSLIIIIIMLTHHPRTHTAPDIFHIHEYESHTAARSFDTTVECSSQVPADAFKEDVDHVI